ncbi:MAG: zinc ABC transporter substrate-binding protein [Chlamydiia bacterium]|nr:zinc ABC transporter substrate-binding protein [Chlamydiia bacterium]
MLYKFLFASLFLLCFGCGNNASPPQTTKPIVLTSIAPYKTVIERISGSLLEVQTIVPPGANPHLFEPTPRQATALSQGKIWFQIGEPFEERLASHLQHRAPSLIVQDLRRGIELLHSDSACDCTTLDRHIWLSPQLLKLQAEFIADVLIEQFPEHREFFQKNLPPYLEELSHLDLEITTLLQPFVNHAILVAHPAFGYFCKDYHLEQLSVEFEGKEPRPKHIESLINRARTSHAIVALSLPQHSSKGAQLLAEHLKIPLHSIDPYDADAIKTMRSLASFIHEQSP